MSTDLALAWRDTVTMSRRSVRRLLRYPSLTLIVVGMPLVFLLLFVYVLGGALGAGVSGAGAGAGREEYLAYLVPGILVMALASVASSTSISIAMDMTVGIVARFKTMSIARSSVLAGHVVAALVQSLVAVVVLTGVALLLGYRTGGSVGGWVLALGLLAAVAVAITWLSVLLGLAAKSIETASNTPMLLVLLPFLGSAFVPTATLPAGLRWFADHQPFTPVIEALRAFLAGGDAGSDAWVALGWCVVVGLGGYLGSRRLYDRDPAAR